MGATDPARRYLTIVQARGGYRAAGEPSEPAPIDGPAHPIIHEVVLSRDYEALRSEAEDLRRALRGMVDLYRHPDTGGTDVNADALVAAKAALGEEDGHEQA